MKALFGLALLAVSAVSASASLLIDDGILATPNLFPSVVKITKYRMENNKEIPVSLCTGTLIAKNIVLTASHCTAEPGQYQRVSLAGDVSGKSSIPVKRTFSTYHFMIYSSTYSETRSYMDSQEYQRLSAGEKNEVRGRLASLTLLMSSSDLAFLELEKDQAIAPAQISSLGCRASLLPGTEALLVGYGKKSINDSKDNFNTAYALNYGFNTIVNPTGQESLYLLNKKAGKQLVNSGDSGGPLFKKGSSSVVYGVASTKQVNAQDKNSISSYGRLSSVQAGKIYKAILQEPSVPVSLGTILRGCL